MAVRCRDYDTSGCARTRPAGGDRSVSGAFTSRGAALVSMREDGAVDLRYFNQTGWTAIFNGTETEIGRMVRVEAWDLATGTALVVDPKRGAMRPVTDYEDFSHLEKADQVVAAVPGGGWRAHWKDEGPGDTPLTEHVLAWLITSQGRATAITMTLTGMLTMPTVPTPSSLRARNWARSELPDQATSVSRSMALRRFFSR